MDAMELVELYKISEKYAKNEISAHPKATPDRKGLTYSRSIRKKGERRIQRSRSKSLPALPVIPPKPFTALDLKTECVDQGLSSDNCASSPDSENESVRIRQFSTTMKKGLVNKGDLRMDGRRDSGQSGMTCRRDSSISVSSVSVNYTPRRESSILDDIASRRNSSFAANYCTPLRRTSCITEREYKRLGHKLSFSLPGSQDSVLDEVPSEYQVLVLGSVGVGKSAIISQFTTSDFLGASDVQTDSVAEKTSISVILNKEESVIELLEANNLMAFNECADTLIDAYMIVYSCTDRNSFKLASDALKQLKEEDSTKTVMLVANKVDLVRKRQVNYEESRILAKTFNCKYIETSAALNHNVDELLAGVLSQIRLKQYGHFVRKNVMSDKKHQNQKGLTRALKTVFKGVFGKKQKFSRCENLYEI